jgi:hypothetical protein
MSWITKLIPQKYNLIIKKNSLKQSFSSKVNLNMMCSISPILLSIFSEMVLYCDYYQLPLKVTSIIREANDGISKSDTHQTGRAIDLSVVDWTELDIKNFTEYFNNKYGSTYGTAPSGKQKQVVVFHRGTGWHFHVQVSRNIKRRKFL